MVPGGRTDQPVRRKWDLYVGVDASPQTPLNCAVCWWVVALGNGGLRAVIDGVWLLPRVPHHYMGTAEWVMRAQKRELGH